MIERNKKLLFGAGAALAFLMIFAYNYLTPYLSDDIIYKIDVGRADSFWDLLKQQYSEYISNSGRVIGQFSIRLSLVNDKMFFNIINSIMFVLLTLLVYVNIKGKKNYDVCLYVIIVGMIWRYSVEFGQTILWLCGACNYLWGSVWILGFITFYRKQLEKPLIRHGAWTALACFVLGVIAGWCNENTSGGGFLLLLMFTFIACRERHKAKAKMIFPYMITAHAGMLCGLLGMLLAPGITKRADVMTETENYSGIVAYLSRFYKCCVQIQDLFLELIIIFIIVAVIAVVYNKSKDMICHNSMPFFVAAAATSFALILAPPPMSRAYFGTGIFLIIACLQAFVTAFTEKTELGRAVRYIVVLLLTVWLFFVYVENIVNLGRIMREENERIELIQEAADRGASSVIVPQYRPAFQNRYSAAHEADMKEDPKYWINHFYENYYGIGEIIAIPRDEWNEDYPDN